MIGSTGLPLSEIQIRRLEYRRPANDGKPEALRKVAAHDNRRM